MFPRRHKFLHSIAVSPPRLVRMLPDVASIHVTVGPFLPWLIGATPTSRSPIRGDVIPTVLALVRLEARDSHVPFVSLLYPC